MRSFEPLIKAKNLKRAAIVRFVSGFGVTLTAEMKRIFSEEGRSFVGAVEYNEVDVDAYSIVLKLKTLHPDVVYLDVQPASLMVILKRMQESGMANLTILTSTVVEPVIQKRQIDLTPFTNLYYTKRAAFDGDFIDRFNKKYHKNPTLEADLGYYGVFLAVDALQQKDPVAALKKGITTHNKLFSFDEHNVYDGIPQEVWKVERDGATRWSGN
jgi:ABC-type branched-subunit amino acid transport system substrate-binding protein